MAATFDRNLEVESFLHSCYHVATYKRAYQHFPNPMDGVDIWPQQGLPILHPPCYHKQPKRPKALRIGEPDEPT